MFAIHNSGHPLGIQQYLDQGGRWVQSGISYPRRVIQTHSDVLQTYKLSSHVPNYDECHLLARSGRGMAFGLYGQYGYTHHQTPTWIQRTTPTMTSRLHPQNPNKIGRQWSLSQTRKMQIQKGRDQIPRGNSRKEPPQDEPKEVTRCSRLACSQNTHQHTMISGLHWLLSILCTKLFCYCLTIIGSHKENHPLALGRKTV